MTTTKDKASAQELDALMSKALRKIKGTKENDICKYLPFNGGYMHHFTLRKLKSESPKELSKMIDQYILDPVSPKRVPHKPRKPRGSRKRPDLINLTRDELDRLLSHVRHAGDHEIAAKFSRKRSIAQIKKALVASIRRHEVDHEMWNAYVEAVSTDSSDKELSQRPVPSAMVQVLSQ